MSSASYSNIRISLVALYSSHYPAIGETHALSVLGGVAKACLGDNLEQLDLFDMVSLSQESIVPLIEFLRYSRPNILGISIGYGTYSFMLREYKHIKAEVGEDCLIVFGGPIPTKIAPELVNIFPDVYVIVGEGEIAFEEILLQRTQVKHLNPSIIHGLVYQKNGKILSNDRLLVNLMYTHLPYRGQVRDIMDAGGQIYCELSRGCSWARCRFCLRGLTDCKGTSDEYRRFPAERIKEDLLQISIAGVLNVTFADEDLLGSKLQQAKLAVETIESAQQTLPQRIEFDASILPSSIFSCKMSSLEIRERHLLLERLVASGLRKVFLGVEAGSDNQLQRYGKAHTADDAAETIVMLRNFGIFIEIGWIMFDPLCTVEELIENIRFIRRNDLVSHISYIFSELRLQPSTWYINLLEKKEREYQTILYNRSLSYDTLSYKYEYLNSDVGQIVSEVRLWKNIVGSVHYPLKNLSRFGNGSVFGEQVASAWDILISLRWSLFEAFETLLSSQEKIGARSRIVQATMDASKKVIKLIEQLPKKCQKQQVVVALKEAATRCLS